MEAKQWLLRARRIEARIEQLDAARTGAWERATSVTQSVGQDGGGRSEISRKPEVYGELAAALDAEIQRLRSVKAEIVDAISQVQDNVLASLLMAYYVNGLTWEQTAVEINYSYYRTVHDKHPQALKAIDSIIRHKTL